MVVKYRPGATAVLYVRMPGWLKNEITEHCAEAGLSTTAWVNNALKHALEADWDVPEAPPAAAPIPTRVDVVRGYLTGEEVLEPCGRISPCERTQIIDVNGIGYCDHCNIRVV